MERCVRFFVESANGDIESALSTFYEADGGEGGEEDAMMGVGGDDDDIHVESTPTVASTGPRTLSGQPAPAMPAEWGTSAAKSSSTAQSGGGFSSGVGRGGIATLRDLAGDSNIAAGPGRGGPSNNDDDDEDDDARPANFFTGGERSGLNVQNPDHRPGANAPDVVKAILKKAADATQKKAQYASGQDSSKSSVPSFTGQGRTINDEAPLEQAEPTSSTATPNSREAPITSEYLRSLRTFGFPPVGAAGGAFGGGEDDDEEEDEGGEGEKAIRNITFWQDGFSIADGPLCRYDDPQHADTLALINANRAPLHLLNIRFGQEVELRVERRTNEKYKPPPPAPMKPFAGQGNRLGAPTPSIASSSTEPIMQATSATAAATTAPATNVPEPSTLFQVDSNQPTTQVQIRLGDGQRLVAKFNHSHTVADIRQYINASHPGMTDRPYTLQPSFPPKPLTDETQTLSEAGLINAVVIQKWS